MEEIKMSCKGMFLKPIITKLISKFIKKKYGANMEIRINEIDISSMDGETYFNLNVDGKMKNEELMKLLKGFI